MASMFARQFLGFRPTLGHQFHLLPPSKSFIRPFRTTPMLRARKNSFASIHTVARNTTRKNTFPFLFTAVGIGGAAIGLVGSRTSTIHCDATTQSTSTSSQAPTRLPPLPPPATSSVNIHELTFGVVCGVCAGVFIKKGAKAVAFFLGGVFVLLQYLGSASLVRVDWVHVGSRFENLFYTTDAAGQKRAPTVYSLWRWIIDFLTADFQPRASFIAGFALGLRVG